MPGFALLIGPGGDLELRLGQGDGRAQVVRSGVPLQERMWTFVGLRGRPGGGQRRRSCSIATCTGRSCPATRAPSRPLRRPGRASRAGPLLLGACGSPPALHLNGKLEAPMLLAGAAGPDQLEGAGCGRAAR